MDKIVKVAIGATAVIGAGFLIKKLVEREIIQDKLKEREALNYLKDKYGDDALDGKKILIVNEEQPVTKARIAKDIAEYEMAKED